MSVVFSMQTPTRMQRGSTCARCLPGGRRVAFLIVKEWPKESSHNYQEKGSVKKINQRWSSTNRQQASAGGSAARTLLPDGVPPQPSVPLVQGEDARPGALGAPTDDAKPYPARARRHRLGRNLRVDRRGRTTPSCGGGVCRPSGVGTLLDRRVCLDRGGRRRSESPRPPAGRADRHPTPT